MNKKIINSILYKLQRANQFPLLEKICFAMYKRKGMPIKSVRYLKSLRVWEFKLDDAYFYSTGPGWVYSHEYLKQQFKENLGYRYFPQAGDVVVDVGAGVGEELMVFSQAVGSTGKVFAIEAHPFTFKALSNNNAQNRFTNTVLLNCAISDHDGFIYIEDSELSLGNRVVTNANGQNIQVKSTTLHSLMQEHAIERIDLLKVNIEGAEQLLIKGIGHSVSKIRNVAISCHDFRFKMEGIEFFKTKKLVVDYLTDHGFAVETRHTGDAMYDDYVYGNRKAK
ncbi:MAG TPA: FkbM family methyltransferase [Chryseosolibacter sp.]